MTRDHYTVDVTVRAFDEAMVDRGARALYEFDEAVWCGDVSNAWDEATEAERDAARDAARTVLRAAIVREARDV